MKFWTLFLIINVSQARIGRQLQADCNNAATLTTCDDVDCYTDNKGKMKFCEDIDEYKELLLKGKVTSCNTNCPTTCGNSASPEACTDDLGTAGFFVCHKGKNNLCLPDADTLSHTLHGDVCGCCGGTCPTTCGNSASPEACTDEFGTAGFFVCHKGKNNLCIPDADTLAHTGHGDTCGCCGGTCPTTCGSSANAVACTDDLGTAGFFVCHKGKKNLCIPDADTLAHTEHGDTCGCCGGTCPTTCGNSANAEACTDEFGTAGFFVCHKGKNNLCIPDADTLAHTGHGDTCGCCGGTCPAGASGCTGASDCTTDLGEAGWLVCHKNKNTQCVTLSESISHILNHGDSCGAC